MMLIIQYTDSIYANSLNIQNNQEDALKLHHSVLPIWKMCSANKMAKFHLIRGYRDTIFYAETNNKFTELRALKMSKTNIRECVSKDVFQFSQGEIVAIEADCELIQDDTNQWSESHK